MSRNLVLGLGGTVDVEIRWSSATLEDLIREFGIRSAELSTAVEIETERDLVRSLLAFVRDGVGGERFVASSAVLEGFSSRFTRTITLGGTCVRAALAAHTLGVASTVHLVSIDDHVRRLLPRAVSYLCSATEDSTDPHLIVQYPHGARITAGDVDLHAEQANRIIYVNDRPNRELRLSPDLGRTLRTADLFLVSGFNTIQDRSMLDQRLSELEQHMRSLPDGALVVYEDGGFHVPALSAVVRDRVVGLVDAYSMNEDEMQGCLGRPLDLLDPASIARALRELHALIPVRTLVVHTRFWSLALSAHADLWRPALVGGVTMASTRYLYGDHLTAADYDATASSPAHEGGRSFARSIEAALGGEAVCVPAFVLTAATPTTIGLGDAFVGGFLAALARDESLLGRLSGALRA